MLRQKIKFTSKDYFLQIFSLPRVAMQIAQKWVHEEVNILNFLFFRLELKSVFWETMFFLKATGKNILDLILASGSCWQFMAHLGLYLCQLCGHMSLFPVWGRGTPFWLGVYSSVCFSAVVFLSIRRQVHYLQTDGDKPRSHFCQSVTASPSLQWAFSLSSENSLKLFLTRFVFAWCSP